MSNLLRSGKLAGISVVVQPASKSHIPTMSDRASLTRALVVEGGAMRGVFSAGVLDAFLDRGFDPFDLYLGVSAGACNLASHLAGQRGRNHRIYVDYSCRPEFISTAKFLRGGHAVDLDWLWEITIREHRLDLDAIFGRAETFLVTLTSVETGEPLYLEPTRDDLEEMLKASSALPFLYRGWNEIRGRRVTDGGVADSLPVREAHRRGARRIMVLRSKPASFVREHGIEARMFALAFRKHPGLVRAMNGRATAYNDAVRFIGNPPPDTEIVQVAPPPDLAIKRTTQDRELLEKAYRVGCERGRIAIDEFR
jgi:predicted patatin/cPLA2 family phospholipase